MSSMAACREQQQTYRLLALLGNFYVHPCNAYIMPDNYYTMPDSCVSTPAGSTQPPAVTTWPQGNIRHDRSLTPSASVTSPVLQSVSNDCTMRSILNLTRRERWIKSERVGGVGAMEMQALEKTCHARRMRVEQGGIVIMAVLVSTAPPSQCGGVGVNGAHRAGIWCCK
jgi:hypothetical protein